VLARGRPAWHDGTVLAILPEILMQTALAVALAVALLGTER
jgi:hypothetical protein